MVLARMALRPLSHSHRPAVPLQLSAGGLEWQNRRKSDQVISPIKCITPQGNIFSPVVLGGSFWTQGAV